jgi:hypothetical protein
MTIELWVDSEDVRQIFNGDRPRFAAWRRQSDAPSRPQFKVTFSDDHYRMTGINNDCVMMERKEL